MNFDDDDVADADPKVMAENNVVGGGGGGGGRGIVCQCGGGVYQQPETEIEQSESTAKRKILVFRDRMEAAVKPLISGRKKQHRIPLILCPEKDMKRILDEMVSTEILSPNERYFAEMSLCSDTVLGKIVLLAEWKRPGPLEFVPTDHCGYNFRRLCHLNDVAALQLLEDLDHLTKEHFHTRKEISQIISAEIRIQVDAKKEKMTEEQKEQRRYWNEVKNKSRLAIAARAQKAAKAAQKAAEEREAEQLHELLIAKENDEEDDAKETLLLFDDKWAIRSLNKDLENYMRQCACFIMVASISCNNLAPAWKNISGAGFRIIYAGPIHYDLSANEKGKRLGAIIGSIDEAKDERSIGISNASKSCINLSELVEKSHLKVFDVREASKRE